jgi:hypothetical protein
MFLCFSSSQYLTWSSTLIDTQYNGWVLNERLSTIVIERIVFNDSFEFSHQNSFRCDSLGIWSLEKARSMWRRLIDLSRFTTNHWPFQKLSIRSMSNTCFILEKNSYRLHSTKARSYPTRKVPSFYFRVHLLTMARRRPCSIDIHDDVSIFGEHLFETCPIHWLKFDLSSFAFDSKRAWTFRIDACVQLVHKWAEWFGLFDRDYFCIING